MRIFFNLLVLHSVLDHLFLVSFRPENNSDWLMGSQYQGLSLVFEIKYPKAVSLKKKKKEESDM